MTKTTFIWRCYFTKLITESHPAVYQYVRGGVRSKETAIKRVTEEIYNWCNPYWLGDDFVDIVFIRGIARQYLKAMEEKWKDGKIKIREIY